MARFIPEISVLALLLPVVVAALGQRLRPLPSRALAPVRSRRTPSV